MEVCPTEEGFGTGLTFVAIFMNIRFVKTQCFPAFECFRTQFTYKCIMVMDCMGVSYKIML